MQLQKGNPWALKGAPGFPPPSLRCSTHTKQWLVLALRTMGCVLHYLTVLVLHIYITVMWLIILCPSGRGGRAQKLKKSLRVTEGL